MVYRVAMNSQLILLLLTISIDFLEAGVCANDCSNRGLCNFDQECECFEGYTFAPDCSLGLYVIYTCYCIQSLLKGLLLSMITSSYFIHILTGSCPFDLSWSDKAYAIDEAHSLAECSDRGLCNRQSVS